MRSVAIFIILTIGIGAVNLSVPIAQESKPSPCLDADIRRAEAEAKAQAQSTLIEAQRYHVDELKKANRELSSRLESLKTTGRRERQQAVTVYDQASQEQAVVISDKDAQLADALRRIQAANRANLCRALRIGCVPR